MELRSNTENERRTISNLLNDVICSTFDPTDSLVVKHGHLSSNGDRAAGQWENGHVDVLLPQVADQIGLGEQIEHLQAGFGFAVSRFELRLSTARILRKLQTSELCNFPLTIRKTAQCMHYRGQQQVLVKVRMRA